MKIVHAIFSFSTGGSETLLVDIMNHQCKEASVSLIVVNDKINPDLLKTLNKDISVFLLGRKIGSKTQLLSAYLKIRKIINRIAPDIIHCHDNNLFPFFVRWKWKTCLTVHGVQLSTAFLRNYRQVFAVSAAVQEDIKQRIGIEAKIIYNGIELAQYQVRNNQDFDSAHEPFKIVQIGRLSPIPKGQHIAIQSMHLLKKFHPDIQFQFYLVGDGDALVELQALAVQYNLQERIIFVGQVDREWVKTRLQDYHLLIQPSLYEGFGLTIIEGFAAGLPVITSNIEGPKEIVDFLNAGLTVEAGNPNDLADKINHIYTCYVSGNLLNSNYLIKNKALLEPFDIQTTVSQYMKQYDYYLYNEKNDY